jgi:DNA-binding NarL/FixJ family response regulator
MEVLVENPPTFVVAEPCKDSQAGLYNMLRKQLKERNINWIQNINSFADVLKELKREPESIVLLNVYLTGFNLKTSLLLIKEKFPKASIILTSTQFSPYFVKMVKDRLMESYLVKMNAFPRHYIDAIDSLTNRKPYIPTDIIELYQMSRIHKLNLSELGWKVFFLYLQEVSVKAIAFETGENETKIRRKIDKIKTITNSHGSMGVMRYALVNGLITPELLELWVGKKTNS